METAVTTDIEAVEFEDHQQSTPTAGGVLVHIRGRDL
jgi:hypothetical protein